MDEGVTLPTRLVLNFIGPGVTATDNPTALRTDVTITGGGGPGPGLGEQTPWLQNIDGNNFELSNVSQISVNGCLYLGPGPLVLCASADGSTLLLNGVSFATVM